MTAIVAGIFAVAFCAAASFMAWTLWANRIVGSRWPERIALAVCAVGCVVCLVVLSTS